MDGAVQLSPSTSHCHASLQRKWPEPWTDETEGAWSERGEVTCSRLWLARILNARETHKKRIMLRELFHVA